MLTKDPNFGIFSDSSGKVSETYQIDSSWVYSNFYNNDLSDIPDDQLAYERIRDSRLHAIVARPAILPYNDTIKWIMEHANPTDHSFNDIPGSQLATFLPDVFIRAYGLKPVRQPLDAYFVRASKTRFNFVEMLKSWMSEPIKFSQRKYDLYPIT